MHSVFTGHITEMFVNAPPILNVGWALMVTRSASRQMLLKMAMPMDANIPNRRLSSASGNSLSGSGPLQIGRLHADCAEYLFGFGVCRRQSVRHSPPRAVARLPGDTATVAEFLEQAGYVRQLPRYGAVLGEMAQSLRCAFLEIAYGLIKQGAHVACRFAVRSCRPVEDLRCGTLVG